MSIRKPLYTSLVAISFLVSSLCSSALAEERNTRAIMQWEGEGAIYNIGPSEVIFLGAFEGIMYFEGEMALLTARLSPVHRANGLISQMPRLPQKDTVKSPSTLMMSPMQSGLVKAYRVTVKVSSTWCQVMASTRVLVAQATSESGQSWASSSQEWAMAAS